MAKEKKKNHSEGEEHRDSNSNGGNLITDSRFSGLHSDPRFQRIPKNKSKVHIDSRFQRMFFDKNFSSSNSSRLDKRGKKKKKSKNPLLHYYHQQQEDHEVDAESEEKKTITEEEDQEERTFGGNRKSKKKEKISDSEDLKEENKIEKTKKRKNRGGIGAEIFGDDDSGFVFESEEKKVRKKKKKKKKKKEGVGFEDNEVHEVFDSEDQESGEKERMVTDLSLDIKCRSSSESELLEEDENFDQFESETSSVSSSSSDDDSDGEIESESELPNQEDVPAIEHATHRLAVVDMDWNHVKAVDLYVLMGSFLPKGGQISSVAIYPSEFGLNRMAEEEVRGPSGIFDSDEENEDNDDNDEIDNEKLRAYEKGRLRYYYAVVDCDSTSTADHLYKTCDGLEFERTSNVLDLRFIPDTLELKHPPRDIATEAPVSYGGLDFHTRALQHSKIHLSWDDDEPQRAKILKRKFNSKQMLDELEFKDFLASDDGDDEDESDEGADLPDNQTLKLNKLDKYRALVQTGDGANADDNDDHDMEITFNTDLENLSKHILEKQKNKEAETVWEAYLRRKKEKKTARKKKSSKFSSEDDSSDSYEEAPDQPDDFFIEEALETDASSRPGKGLKEKKQSQEIDKEQEASRGELELLFADEKGTGESVKGYNLKAKRRNVKGKMEKEMPAEDKLPTVDYDDPRFSSLFNNHYFALDPTDPQFKRSAAYGRQLAQKQAKGGKIVEEQKNLNRHHRLESGDASRKKGKDDLSLLIQSVKKKAGALKC